MCAATSAWAAITTPQTRCLHNRHYLLPAPEADGGLGAPAPALPTPLRFVHSDGYKSSRATPSKKLGRRDSLLPPSSLHILLSPLPAHEVGVCGAEGPAALVRLPLPTGCSGPSELAEGERKRSFGMQVVLKQLSQQC